MLAQRESSSDTPIRPGEVEIYISKQEVARRLSVSTRTVERATGRGLPKYLVGGQTRYLWSEVVAHFALKSTSGCAS